MKSNKSWRLMSLELRGWHWFHKLGNITNPRRQIWVSSHMFIMSCSHSPFTVMVLFLSEKWVPLNFRSRRSTSRIERKLPGQILANPAFLFLPAEIQYFAILSVSQCTAKKQWFLNILGICDLLFCCIIDSGQWLLTIWQDRLLI